MPLYPDEIEAPVRLPLARESRAFKGVLKTLKLGASR
jgi:hypothetical protein